MTKITLHESAQGLMEAKASGTPGLYEIRLIAADVQGSSGYYSREILERDGAVAFPAGTKVFLDHPSQDELENRPERSVRHIAGYLTKDAEMREDGLYGPVKFGRDYQTFIEDFHSVLGMSIRAAGEIEESEDESGTIRRNVTAIYPGPLNSVDVVTAPGAQGAIVSALHESFREITENKETERTVHMDEQDIKRIVEAVTAALTPLVESLKPEAPVEEVTEPDLAAVTESALAAGLTKTARARVVAAVRAGTEVEEAIQAEKTLADEILAEAAAAATVEESVITTGRIVEGGKVDPTEAFNSLNFGLGK